ncbi:hypothetical protein [Alloactinosynnema sp. L-07]|uniref:hypothetical protein n=1 Tax=Alloactinosynnema sp. L-07 TaxID=1653480 RepID=UPI0006B43E00|nr:hypothetical protein [Alloactinosynnema sp. L-07]
MIDTSHRMKLTAASGALLHDVRFATADELDGYEGRRLFGIDPPASDLAACHCGWTHNAVDLIAAAGSHLRRDPSLPVHHVGAHTAIGTRHRNADSFGSAVDFHRSCRVRRGRRHRQPPGRSESRRGRGDHGVVSRARGL